MKLIRFLPFVVICFLPFTTLGADLSKVQLITENYPPYNYRDGNQIKGITVEVLLAATKEAGIPVDRSKIDLWPWARGYRQALTGPMTMLFSMSRTKEREDKFQRAGQIIKSRIGIITRKKDKIKVSSPADLKPFKIGAVLDDIGEQRVRSVIGGLKIETSSTPEVIAKKLNAGRLDMWAYNESVANWILKSAGFNPNDFEMVYVLLETESYFAFSKDVPKNIINKLQMGLDKLKAKDGGAPYQKLIQ